MFFTNYTLSLWYSHSWETTTVIRSTTEPSVTTTEATAANPLSRLRRLVACLYLGVNLTLSDERDDAGFGPGHTDQQTVFVSQLWSHTKLRDKSRLPHVIVFPCSLCPTHLGFFIFSLPCIQWRLSLSSFDIYKRSF